MNLATAMLYPVMLVFPASGMVGQERSVGEGHEIHAWQEPVSLRSTPVTRSMLPAWPFAITAYRRVEPESARQVRIEQRMTIRITPRASQPVSPDMFVGSPDGDPGIHFTERKIGKCLPAEAIAGVQPDDGNRLLLFMRDRRIVSAELERACRARDFYSGFYLTRSSDGKLCVDRDTLLSRSGMNCKLTRIRQLVEADR